LKATLFEAVLVVVVGVVLAFAANALSPRGLKLTQDFFPGAETQSPTSPKILTQPGVQSAVNNSPVQLAARQIREQGLQVVEGSEAKRLFHKPGHESDQIIFIDARDDQHYSEGHIPGAYQFDHYHAEKYFASVLPACEQAQQIVVYCHGGECEDSRFAGIMLRDAGIPKEKLFVYVGGVTEWQAAGMPLESGVRNSGNLVK
jgi:rhodanese-related sulfurtransferase